LSILTNTNLPIIPSLGLTTTGKISFAQFHALSTSLALNVVFSGALNPEALKILLVAFLYFVNFLESLVFGVAETCPNLTKYFLSPCFILNLFLGSISNSTPLLYASFTINLLDVDRPLPTNSFILTIYYTSPLY